MDQDNALRKSASATVAQIGTMIEFFMLLPLSEEIVNAVN
jgi:hypothetical protein